jgi:hypothetical protein
LHEDTLRVLYRAFDGGFSTKSDFARAKANHVACAASLGLITTALPDQSFSNQWRTTEAGIKVLFEQYFYKGDE